MKGIKDFKMQTGRARGPDGLLPGPPQPLRPPATSPPQGSSSGSEEG